MPSSAAPAHGVCGVLSQLGMYRNSAVPKSFTKAAGVQGLRTSMALAPPLSASAVSEGAVGEGGELNIGLPVALELDAATDIKIKVSISADAKESVYRAILKNGAALRRNDGDDAVIVKDIVVPPNAAEGSASTRFVYEVWLRWALYEHPNIARLVGYTLNPRMLVLRQYPIDLYHFLHVEGNTSDAVDPYLAYYLCARIASAVAAIHELGAAHRDIKSANVLLQEPPMVGVFPAPILSDFGFVRMPRDPSPLRFSGISMRYAAPEVIQRFQNRQSHYPIAADRAADVYALGVLFWEILVRQIPWDRVPTAEIMRSVGNGARLPQLETEGASFLYVMTNGLVDAMLLSDPNARPSSKALVTTPW